MPGSELPSAIAVVRPRSALYDGGARDGDVTSLVLGATAPHREGELGAC